MKKRFTFLVVLLLLLVLPGANAAITLRGHAAIYNLGDNLDIEVNISESEPLNGFITLNLDCDNSSLLFYKVPLSIEAEKEKFLEVPSLFLSEHMLGLCYIKAALEDIENNAIDEVSTEHFTVSNIINLTVVFNKKVLLPGEKLAIEGKAIKLNGKKLDGSAKVTLDGVDYPSLVKDSFFEVETSLAKDIKSNEHVIEIFVFDSFGNKGSAFGTIFITPVPTTLELMPNKGSFLPEEDLSVRAILYDQAHDEISRNVILSLTSPAGKEQLNVKVLTGELVGYTFERGALPGNWQIKAISSGLEAKGTIVMQEHKAIDMSLAGSILHIINMGNVLYAETIGVEFKQGDSITAKNETISLDVGEETSIKLSAPNGNYDVSVEGVIMKKTFSNVPLTGSVIAVRKLSDIRKANFIKYSSIVLLFVIILLLIGKKLSSSIKEKRKREALKTEEGAIYQYMQKFKNGTE